MDYGCITPLPATLFLYHCGQFYWWKNTECPGKHTNVLLSSDKLNHAS